MALETVGGAVLGVALPGVWKAGVYLYDVFRGSTRKKFEENVKNLLPTIKEICESSSESSLDSSLKKFKEFHHNIAEGNRLVDECQRSRNFLWQFRVRKRVKKLQKYINKFIRNDLPPVMALLQIQARNSHSAQLESVIQAQDSHSTQLENVRVEVENVRRGVEQLQHTQISQQDESLCEPPDPPRCLLGFDEHIEKVKKLVLEDGVNVIGITAMGGAGKSTLAMAVCHHNEIKEYFKQRVIYIVVSKSPDLLSILKSMWKDIVGGQEPDFTNIEDARNKLQRQINSSKKPTLVVLDDIWSKFHLEKLLFEGEQYKTVVTTRDKDVIPKGPKTRIYELPLLQQEHALKLFCCCAFGESSIPSDQDKEVVEKVQQECNGLPLALKVIGSSLYGESYRGWERAKKRLSAGESFKDDNKESLLNKLKTSIDVLDDNEKQCFLDLVAFPQRKTVPANELLNIWVYVRGMKSDQADILLLKFAARHLLDFKKNPWNPGITDDCMNGYSFSQHDVMRDLALYLGEQDNSIQCRRLYMPKKIKRFPSKWQIDRDLSSKAQIISIHTGAMKDTQWPEMEFPEAEALILYFTASDYCIPTFLHTMKKLKVLIIHNDDRAKRTKLSGLAGFQALSQLKTLHLERLIVPEDCKVSESLEKIYLSLCEGLRRDKIFNFPGLLEFNVDYCFDLEELPAGLCSLVSLKMLSVTHCHRLAKLPDELDKLDKLGSLKEIRLCESPGLKALPSSICSLKKLKFLDISSCIHLKVNRGERCELKETLETLAKLPSLKRVICDEKNERLFNRSSRTDLKVQAVVEQEPNLDWLDWEWTKLEF